MSFGPRRAGYKVVLLQIGSATRRPFVPHVTHFLCLLVLLLGTVPVSAMNLVRVETRADRALAELNATGRGVLIAILDRVSITPILISGIPTVRPASPEFLI